MKTKLALGCVLCAVPFFSHAAILEFGDEDLLGTGAYGSDPKAGATLLGLAPNAVTYSTLISGHGFGFDPSDGDFAGTDQIYVGNTQTSYHDGYSGWVRRKNGPQIFQLNYASLVPTGERVETITLGIAADDFQQVPFGQPFSAKVNGVDHARLTSTLNAFNQTGPVVQFFTIGLDPTSLMSDHVLTVAIDEGGDGGDGWAVDFLTVGVTTTPVPEPSSMAVLGLGALALMRRRRR